jgi:nucleoid-associated protein YgaU
MSHARYIHALRATRRNRMRRRNPDLTLEDMIAVADQMGFSDLAGLLRAGGPLAQQLVQEIRAAVQETDTLSDVEAWAALAGLVPRAIPDQPAAVQQALIAEFQRRSVVAA